MKKRLPYAILFLLIFLFADISQAQPSASGTRSIENNSIQPGQSTIISLEISTTMSQALSLQEKLPDGWTLTRISDDAESFKASTNEWVWFDIGEGTIKTIRYRLTVPSSATSGAYSIEGSISNSSGVIASVSGDASITVTGGQASAAATVTAMATTTTTVSPTVTKTTSGSANVPSTPAKVKAQSVQDIEIKVIPDRPAAGDNISLKADLTYPTAGYIVDFGEASVQDKSISVNIRARPPSGMAAQVITTYSHVYNLGNLSEGSYVYSVGVNGTTERKGGFEVSSGGAGQTGQGAPASNAPSGAGTAKAPGFGMGTVVVLISYATLRMRARGR